MGWPPVYSRAKAECPALDRVLKSGGITSPWREISQTAEWTVEKWESALSSRGTDDEAEAYLRLGQYLFAYAKRYLKTISDLHLYLRRQSDADLDDLIYEFVQRTIEKVWSHYEGFAWRSHIKTWATSILIREIKQFLRRSATRKEILVSHSSSADADDCYIGSVESAARATPVARPERMPEISLARQEFVRDLGAALAKLSDKQRYAFVECCVCERSAIDVAQELKISVDAVYQHVSRARRKLRVLMGELGYESGFYQ